MSFWLWESRGRKLQTHFRLHLSVTLPSCSNAKSIAIFLTYYLVCSTISFVYHTRTYTTSSSLSFYQSLSLCFYCSSYSIPITKCIDSRFTCTISFIIQLTHTFLNSVYLSFSLSFRLHVFLLHLLRSFVPCFVSFVRVAWLLRDCP